MTDQRPWYHRPEWIMLAVIAGGSVLTGASAIAHNDAQTNQNTRDIAELKGDVHDMPERLARIETKVDDLTKLEKARSKGSGD